MLSIEKYENAPCVFVYKNAFDVKNFIEKIEEETEQSWPYLDWVQSKTGDGEGMTMSEYRTSLEMYMETLFSAQVERLDYVKDLFINEIFKDIDKCVWDYRNAHDLNLRADSGYTLLKYSNGGEYHIHQDHSPQNERVLSLVACFGEEFEGGELEFPYFNLTIKLEKNSLVLFPSNFPYSHIAHPVTSGVKYSLVTWFI